MKTYIVAGTFQEFNQYISKKRSAGIETDNYRYVSDVNQLRGLSECHGFFIGTYKQRSDLMDIQTQIKLINRRRAASIPIGKTISSVILDDLPEALM